MQPHRFNFTKVIGRVVCVLASHHTVRGGYFWSPVTLEPPVGGHGDCIGLYPPWMGSRKAAVGDTG